jgi:hypothetical protein
VFHRSEALSNAQRKVPSYRISRASESHHPVAYLIPLLQTITKSKKRKQVTTGAYWRPIKEKKKADEVSGE